MSDKIIEQYDRGTIAEAFVQELMFILLESPDTTIEPNLLRDLDFGKVDFYLSDEPEGERAVLFSARIRRKKIREGEVTHIDVPAHICDEISRKMIYGDELRRMLIEKRLRALQQDCLKQDTDEIRRRIDTLLHIKKRRKI